MMRKKIILFDLLVAVISVLIIQLIHKDYTFPFLLGLAIASIGFIVSEVSLDSLLVNKKKKLGVFASIFSFFKVFIICIIGVILFNNNIKYITVYILGFTSHLIAIILCVIFNVLNERK